MRSTRFTLIGSLGVGLVLAVGAADCGSASNGGGQGGSGGTSAATGGKGGSATGGNATGGSPSTGGTTGTGGAATGGSPPGTGGSASGGMAGTGPAGGRGGHAGTVGNGGTTGNTGGHAGAGPGTGGTGTGGSGTGTGGTGAGTGGGGGTSPGTCQKGQTKGSDVVIMGESFYAISPQYIQNRIQDDARMAGSLGASDTYRNVAVSGQNMNYIATTEWTAATQGGAAPKYVIMDGGGIDCLSGSSCPTCQATLTSLLAKMGTAGVKQVIYTRYPEPGNPPGSNTSLKACLDATMPGMQTACQGSTSPVCHFVDLRPVWVNGDTSDGLHPTQSGGDHVGDLIWSEMMKDCIAQ